MGSPAYAEKPEKIEEADRSLVLRAREGDPEAFEALVRAYQRRVYGVALRMTRRHEVADDVTQETFVRAYRQLHRFELGRPLAPWLIRIAVNLSLNHLTGPTRKETPWSQGPDGEDRRRSPIAPTAAPGDPLQALLSGELLEALDRAVETLPAEQRAVLVLKVHQEMRYEEIAEALGISTGTVMSRLFRARAKLRRLLADYL